MAKKPVKRPKPKRVKAATTAPATSATPQEAILPTLEPTTTPETTTESVVPQTPHKIGHNLYLGAWAYVLGILVAIGAAVFMPAGLDYYTIVVLALFGIVVGLMNITDEEVLLFLVASIAFIVSTTSVRAVLPEEFVFLKTLLHGIIIFTGAGAFVVAFKALFKVARNE